MNLQGKEYHKNPRKITKRQFELLNDSLDEFGDLSGVILNTRTQEFIGGNQRSKIFQQKGAELEITQRYETPTKTGTVAQGFILVDGEKYSYREVDWDKRKEESANIRANKIGGSFDFDILANQFDVEILTESGFVEEELFNSPVGNITNLKTVNNGDETSDWVGMPDFEAKDNSPKIIIHFENKEDREEFAQIHNLEFIKKLENAWSTNYPYTGRQDMTKIKYDTDSIIDEDVY